MRIQMLMRTSMGLVIGMGMSGLAAAKSTVHKVDTNKSVISWVGKKVSGQHDGTLKLKSGTVVIENGQLKSGEFVLDMNSIDNNDLSGEWKTKLVNHLKSDDFFNVKAHPTAQFKTTNVKPSKKLDDYTATGDLVIKGIKKPITIPLTLVTAGGTPTIKGNVKINRLNWDIKYNSGKFFDAKKLGDKMIYDDIEVGVRLVTLPAVAKSKKAAANTPKKKVMHQPSKKN